VTAPESENESGSGFGDRNGDASELFPRLASNVYERNGQKVNGPVPRRERDRWGPTRDGRVSRFYALTVNFWTRLFPESATQTRVS
jgi:hypothetical protein